MQKIGGSTCALKKMCSSHSSVEASFSKYKHAFSLLLAAIPRLSFVSNMKFGANNVTCFYRGVL